MITEIEKHYWHIVMGLMEIGWLCYENHTGQLFDEFTEVHRHNAQLYAKYIIETREKDEE